LALHQLGRLAGRHKDRVGVHLELASKRLVGLLVDRTSLEDARVVHDDIQPLVSTDDLLHHRLDRGPIGDVGGSVSVLLADWRGEGGGDGLGAAPADAVDRGAGCREARGDTSAQAPTGRRTRDERSLSREILAICMHRAELYAVKGKRVNGPVSPRDGSGPELPDTRCRGSALPEPGLRGSGSSEGVHQTSGEHVERCLIRAELQHLTRG